MSPPPPAAMPAVAAVSRPSKNKTGFAKVAIAIASIAMTVGGWALFAGNEPAAAQDNASAEAPAVPTAAVTLMARSARVSNSAPGAIATIAVSKPVAVPVIAAPVAGQSISPQVQKQLRVVTAPTVAPASVQMVRPRIVTRTRSSQ